MAVHRPSKKEASETCISQRSHGLSQGMWFVEHMGMQFMSNHGKQEVLVTSSGVGTV